VTHRAAASCLKIMRHREDLRAICVSGKAVAAARGLKAGFARTLTFGRSARFRIPVSVLGNLAAFAATDWTGRIVRVVCAEFRRPATVLHLRHCMIIRCLKSSGE
jgi:hypothetical protein